MTKFQKVSMFYKYKKWDLEQVKEAVTYGWITAEQFKTITGEEYVATTE